MSHKPGSHTTSVVQYDDDFDIPRSPVITNPCHDAAECFDAVDVKLRRRNIGTLQIHTICSARDPASSKDPDLADMGEHQVDSHTKPSIHPSICLQGEDSLH